MTTTLSLKGRALKYLAAREHSRLELARKLATTTGEARERIDEVLDDLQARGLLSEQRYVESLLHRRSASHGSARIKRELQSHGVDTEAVTAALHTLQASEQARATALWRRRFGSRATDAREHARQARFLLARGFSAELVQRVLRDGAVETDGGE
jgi:regulatory protein